MRWEQRSRGAAVYFAVQGLAGAAWWAVMFAAPAWRPLFRTSLLGDEALLLFIWPDLPLFVLGSLLCAAALWRRPSSPWTQRLVWFTVGTCAYPALYVTGGTLWTGGEGWAATSAMLAASAGAGLAAWTARPDGALFVEATPGSAGKHLLHTLLHSVIFWALFLVFVPWLIVQAEASLGVPRFETPGQQVWPWIAFGLAASLNVSSGYTMARYGQGTPLPMETAQRLVVVGPYRYLRNPMAVGGLAMAAAIGWWLGSWGVVAMAVAGGLLWHVFVRPVEERDMVERFGRPFEAYRDQVRCWIPRWPPYRR